MVVVYEETGQITTTPPTQAALHQAVFRAHYQLQIWNNDILPNPVLKLTEGFGWKWEEDKKA